MLLLIVQQDDGPFARAVLTSDITRPRDSEPRFAIGWHSVPCLVAVSVIGLLASNWPLSLWVDVFESPDAYQ